jgi:hypothetical protein
MFPQKPYILTGFVFNTRQIYFKNLIVPRWTSHRPQEQKNRVRFPPRCKIFREKHSNAVVHS